MLKTKISITYVLIVLLLTSCKSQNIDKTIEQPRTNFQSLSDDEVEHILQEGLNTNHLDMYFSEEDKVHNITILINEFISPYFEGIALTKFGNAVRFRSYEEIYNDLNEKFIDIDIINQSQDELVINYAMRSRFNSMFVHFKKQEGKWVKITKNFDEGVTNMQTTQFAKNKETCLARAILRKKYPEKYHYLSPCFNFLFSE